MTRLSNGALALLAALLGAAYAFLIFDPSFIVGTSPYWTEPYTDRTTHMIGSMYFVRDDWRFPLFYIPKLAFPEGANIVFTDSLPLLALVFKVFYELTGQWINYFGYWVFACFPLLAIFTALACREAGARDVLAPLCAALIAVASPELLVRLGIMPDRNHAALMSQFLIAWSLLLYLRLRSRPGDRGVIAQFCLVAVLAILLQAYFVLMVASFLFAALAQATSERRLRLVRAAATLAVFGACIAATAWMSGLVGGRSFPATAGGFGIFSMNLVSPFLPPRERLPVALERRVTWDASDYTWDATGGQYEGYNYLGAGLLLLLAVHLLLSWRIALPALKRHAFLVLVLIGLSLFSISSRIYLGDRLVYDLRLPKALAAFANHFRSGGRMFWPVYFVLAVALVSATVRRFNPRVASAVLVVAVALQLADTQVLRRELAVATVQGSPQVLPRGIWESLIEAHDSLEQYPSFQCGGWSRWRPPGNNANMEMLWIAAKFDKATNSAYLARLTRDCAAESAHALAFDIRPGVLYVFSRSLMVQLAGTPEMARWCKEFEYGMVCSRDWARLPQLATLAYFRPIAGDWAPAYALGEIIGLYDGGDGEPYLSKGWFDAESWARWAGKDAELRLRIPPGTMPEVQVNADAQIPVSPDHPMRQVAVYANESHVATWTSGPGWGVEAYCARIPAELFRDTGVLRIRFASSSAVTPRQGRVSDDSRLLSIAVVDLSVSAPHGACRSS